MRRGHRHASLLGLAALIAAAFGPHESARAGTPPPGKSGPEGGAPAPAIERIAGDLKGTKPFPVEDPKKARAVPGCVQAAYARLTAEAKTIRAAALKPDAADEAIATRKREILSRAALLAAGCPEVE